MLKAPSIFVLVLALLFLVHGCASQCEFTPGDPEAPSGEFVGSISELESCYSDILHSSYLDEAQNFVDVLNIVAQLYSFADIAINSSTPYNIQVDIQKEIKSTLDGSWQAHRDFYLHLSQVFKKLKDEHTQVTAPNPYGRQRMVLPFALRSAIDEDNKQYLIAAPGYLGDLYDTKTGLQSKLYYGKKIVEINGEDALTFVKNWAAENVGKYKDVGIQFNDLIDKRGPWHYRPMDQYDYVNEYTYLIEDDLLVYQNLFVSDIIADKDEFVAGFSPFANKKRDAIDNSKSLLDRLLLNTVDPIFEIQRSRLYQNIPEEMKEKAEFLMLGNPKMHLNPRTSGKRSFKQEDIQNADLRLVDFSEEGEIGSWEYRKQAMVIKLTSLLALNKQGLPAPDLIRAPLLRSIKQAREAGYKELILDLTRCPGGQVALAFQLVADLVKEFDGATMDNEANLFTTIDFRKSEYTDLMFANNDSEIAKNRFLDITTFEEPASDSWYTASISRTRSIGGTAHNFTQPVFFNLAHEVGGYKKATDYFQADNGPPYYFDKIIVLTDGRCGSSCGQFLNMLRSNDRVRVLGVGGIVGEAFDSVSFPGGTAVTYNGVRMQLKVATQAHFPELTTTSSVAFNFFETYEKCSTSSNSTTLPRDYIRVAPDDYIPYWDAIYENVWDATPTGVSNTVALYDKAYPYFNRMPGGLPGLPPRPRSSSATNYCSDTSPLTPVSGFSRQCVGEWIDTTECSAPCKARPWPNGGSKKQIFKIYVTGDEGEPCEFGAGDVRDVSCNTQPCDDCVGSFLRTTVECQANCRQSFVYNVIIEGTPQGAKCPNHQGDQRNDLCEFGKCTLEPPTDQRQSIDPFIHCIEKLATGANAYFGYYNRNNKEMFLDATSNSTKNFFSGSQRVRVGQPTNFAPGFQPFAYKLAFNDITLSWTIDGTVTTGQATAATQCPTSEWNVPIIVKSATAPTSTHVTRIAECLTTGFGVASGRLLVSADKEADSLNLYRFNVTLLGPAPGSSPSETALTIPVVISNFANKLRTEPSYLTTALSSCAAYPYSDIAVEWDSLILKPGPVSPTQPDDQLDPPAPAEPIPTTPSSASTFVVSFIFAIVVATFNIMF